MLISCYMVVGDNERALDAARRTLALAEKLVLSEPSNGDIMAGAVGALAKLGAAERAKEWAERAMLLDPDNMNMCYNIACTLITDLQDFDAALEMLRPYLARVGNEALDWAKHDPDLDPIRSDDRFQEMLRQADARLGIG